MFARRSPRRCRRPALSKATRLVQSARASRWRRCDGMDRGIEGGGGDLPRLASSPVLPVGNMLRRRGCAGLENVQRIDAACFVVAWNKNRVSAAMDRSDNHEIVRQM